MMAPVLAFYGLDEKNCVVAPFGNGLINDTWKISNGTREFLLQKINRQVFPQPADIMDNLNLLSTFFQTHYPEYLFVAPLFTISGKNFVMDADNNYYRLFRFVENSYSCDTIADPSLAYEASRQFGKFTRLLSTFDPALLHVTLPDFHNLTLRHRQFETAVRNGNKQRIRNSAESIDYLRAQQHIVDEYERIKKDPNFEIRVVHHDAKINNVLFERKNNTGLCLVDLDTVMPGFYISDVGDMLRTYICPVDEEEPDFTKILIREEYFQEIVNGYLGEMKSVLSNEEKHAFVYAGKFAIYMQALRFLTDYLNEDIYYSIKYAVQNRVRANNQITLLKRFLEKEDRLHNILISFLQKNSK